MSKTAQELKETIGVTMKDIHQKIIENCQARTKATFGVEINEKEAQEILDLIRKNKGNNE